MKKVFLIAASLALALCTALPIFAKGQSEQSQGASVSGAETLPIDPATGYPKYDKPVTLTWWSWNITAKPEVAIFEKYYPNITVDTPNVGAGTTVYNKLSTSIQANAGLPDLVMLEYSVVSQFSGTGALADISPYVNQFKPDFPKWVWNQVSDGSKVFGMPGDQGPMGLWYRKPLFDENNLAVPTTWDQFKQEALQFHQAHPDKYFTYFASNDGQWITALLWQAGISPFKKTSDGWKINLNSPQIAKVLQFWVDLVKSGAVQDVQTGTPAWEKNMHDGLYAAGIGASWYINQVLVPWVKDNLESQGWRAAFIPAWTQGDTTDGNYGGSAHCVLKATKDLAAAEIFDAFINTSKYELALYGSVAPSGGNGPFPASSVAFGLPTFATPNPMLGGQSAFKDIFAVEAPRIYPDFQWSPWSSYIFNSMQVEIEKVLNGTESLKVALDNVQQQTVSYAQSQGVKVTQ